MHPKICIWRGVKRLTNCGTLESWPLKTYWDGPHHNKTERISNRVHTSWTLIARLMEPTWVPSGVDRTQMGPMLTPWTLLSGLWDRCELDGPHRNKAERSSNRVHTWMYCPRSTVSTKLLWYNRNTTQQTRAIILLNMYALLTHCSIVMPLWHCRWPFVPLMVCRLFIGLIYHRFGP